MKKITLLLAFVACTMFVSAQLIVSDNFDYTVGSLISNGWIGTGNSQTPPSTLNPIQVTAATITYAGYPGSGVGNEISIGNTGEDLNKSFPAAISTGIIYFSALVNISAAQATGDYFLHIADAATGTAFFARTFAKLDAGKVAFGIVNSSGTGSTPSYITSTYDLNVTHLIVVKFNTSTREASIVVNPTIGETEPNTWLSNTTGPTAIPTVGFSTINIRQGSASNAPTLKLDGIRVATSWSALFTASGLNATKESKLEVVVSGKNLLVKNVIEGSEVEIFSALGSKVQTSNVENGKISIANLKNGLYVVRSGKLTQKIML